jgi:hypothetical protein
MFMFDWSAYDPPAEGHRVYPIDVLHLNFNILFQLRLKVSISVVPGSDADAGNSLCAIEMPGV